MKKTLAILLVLLISVSALVACGDETGSRRDRNKNNDKTIVSDVAETDSEPNPYDYFEFWDKKPAEEVLEIFIDNSEIWKQELSYAMGGSIFFLDLDRDNYPELITTTVQGTGLFSSNHYYKINPDTNSVTEIPCESGIAYDGDFFTEGYPKLYMNLDTAEKFYVISDTMRAGMGAYSRAEGKIALNANGAIVSETLWGYDYTDAKISASGEEEYVYRVSGTTVEKETYEKTVSDFENTHKNIPIEFESINLAEFNEADESTQHQMLLDCYNSLK